MTGGNLVSPLLCLQSFKGYPFPYDSAQHWSTWLHPILQPLLVPLWPWLSKPHILARSFLPQGSAHTATLVRHPFASASLQLKNHFRRESFPSGVHTLDLLVHLSVCAVVVWHWTYHNYIFICMNTISFHAVNFVVAGTWWIRFFAELSTQPSCLSPASKKVLNSNWTSGWMTETLSHRI